MKERFERLKATLLQLKEKIQESEAYQQLKAKYDQLDSQQKLYVQIGGLGSVVIFILFTVFFGISKVNGLKNEIDEQEELIGFLQQAGNTIQQYKAQATSNRSGNASAPLNMIVTSQADYIGLNPAKIETTEEKNGSETKDSKEILVDVKLTEVNLRQLTRLLYQVTEYGASRNLNIKNLKVDTRNEFTGWLNAQFTVSAYKPK